MRYWFLVTTIVLLPLMVGCGKRSDGVAVSGRITRDNQPVAKAQVIFQGLGSDGKPDANREAGGETDDDGRYTLIRVKDQSQSILPGEYRVEIHVIERSAAGIRERIPPQYNRDSKLKFTVPSGGTKDANFDVKSK